MRVILLLFVLTFVAGGHGFFSKGSGNSGQANMPQQFGRAISAMKNQKLQLVGQLKQKLQSGFMRPMRAPQHGGSHHNPNMQYGPPAQQHMSPCKPGEVYDRHSASCRVDANVHRQSQTAFRRAMPAPQNVQHHQQPYVKYGPPAQGSGYRH